MVATILAGHGLRQWSPFVVRDFKSKGMEGRGTARGWMDEGKRKRKKMSSSCWKAGIPARQFKACLKKIMIEKSQLAH